MTLTYTANDRTPYTYHIAWSKLNIHYYGVRFKINCHPSEFWVKYKTSSKRVKDFIIEHGDPDIIQIRKVFNSKETARDWECKVLHRLKVTRNKNWLNMSNGKSFRRQEGKPLSIETRKKISNSLIGLMAGENNPFYGKKHSVSTLEKIKNTKKNNPFVYSNELRKEISIRTTGHNNPHYGKKHSAETIELFYKQRRNISDIERLGYETATIKSRKQKQFLTGNKMWTNGIINTWSRVSPGEGWINGKTPKRKTPNE